MLECAQDGKEAAHKSNNNAEHNGNIYQQINAVEKNAERIFVLLLCWTLGCHMWATRFVFSVFVSLNLCRIAEWPLVGCRCSAPAVKVIKTSSHVTRRQRRWIGVVLCANNDVDDGNVRRRVPCIKKRGCLCRLVRRWWTGTTSEVESG